MLHLNGTRAGRSLVRALSLLHFNCSARVATSDCQLQNRVQWRRHSAPIVPECHCWRCNAVWPDAISAKHCPPCPMASARSARPACPNLSVAWIAEMMHRPKQRCKLVRSCLRTKVIQTRPEQRGAPLFARSPQWSAVIASQARTCFQMRA